MTGSLDEVADQLYGVPPAEFVATRNEQAAVARREGDRTLASEITKLRRPTVGAWLVNLLARERRSDLDDLLRIGQGLRQAQTDLDRDRMRSLSEERHEVVGRLSADARSLAAQAGQQAGEQILAEVVATLDAAVADEAAAEAVASGRLTTALRYAGLGSAVDTGTVATAPRTTRPPKHPAPAEPRPDPEAEAAASRAQAALEAAEREVQAANAALGEADDDVREAESRLAAARQRRVRARQDLQTAERELRHAQREARRFDPDSPSHRR